MIDFTMEQLFPDFILADKNGFAMAKSIEKMLRIMCSTVQAGVDNLQNVNKMQEWRLDEMAWEMNLLWYDYTADVSIKREQIAGAQEYYTRLGTKAAVERAISDVFGLGRLEEWNVFGGEPYTFRVYTSDPEVALSKRQRFLALLEVVKNVRSSLESIVYTGADGKAAVNIGTKAIGCSYNGAGVALGKLPYGYTELA